MILGIIFLNIVLRFIYILYGYIAAEEATLLYNQQLAYSGKLPFINYDAWSSLYHDYLLGWQQFIFGPSLLGQRFVGLCLSLIVFWLTLVIAKKLVGPKTIWLTSLLLTIGSLRYLYTSTIPYSEQFMTLFILLSLLFLLKSRFAISLSLITAAGLIRSQALPLVLIIWIYLSLILPRRKWLRISFITLSLTLIILFPFLIHQPASVFWAFFWPLQADKILIYQQGASTLTLTSFITFLIELAQDYGLLLLLAATNLISFKFSHRRNSGFIILLNLILFSQIVVALFHKPPFTSYIYPFVPLLVILASLNFKSLIQSRLLVGLLMLQLILFPHYRFLKTSLSTLQFTPHYYLNQLAEYLKTVTNPDDQIISFYLPVNIAAHRSVMPQFTRDRFSLTLLPQTIAAKHHLVTLEEFRSLIKSQIPDALILTDKTLRIFGTSPEEQQATLTLINQYYYPDKIFPQISFIEDPKTKQLFIYLRR